MALLELHKHHGAEEGEIVVELVSDAPDTHIFSSQYVDAEAALGWLEFGGDPIEYEVTPDPLGEYRDAGPLTLRTRGDSLVMHVIKDGEQIDVVYKITHVPVPRGWRLPDKKEFCGVRIAPEYGLKRVKSSG